MAPQPRRSDAAGVDRRAADLRAAGADRAADLRAAGADLRAADLQAAGADRRAADRGAASASSADLRKAGAAARGDASERPRNSEPRRRRRAGRNLDLFVTVMGQKYHRDVACKGLRNAHTVHRCSRCQTCGPDEDRPVVPLYGFGPDMPLHSDHQHARSFQLNGGEDGEIKRYDPCAICMYGP